MTVGVAEFPAIDGVDTVRGLSSVGANPLVYRRLLALFCEQHGDDGCRLSNLLDAGQRADAARLIHRLRGSALILGMLWVSHDAARIEHDLGEGADPHAAASTDALIESLTSVIAAVRRTFPEPVR